jgi:hypothetical protein
MTEGPTDLSIYDATGKLVYRRKISANEEQIDISNFNKGLYTVCIDATGYQGARCVKFVK